MYGGRGKNLKFTKYFDEGIYLLILQKITIIVQKKKKKSFTDFKLHAGARGKEEAEISEEYV